MMSSDQKKVVIQTYNHLIENEKRGWDDLDDYMEYLDYLDNAQLKREVDVIYANHRGQTVKCQQNHAKEKCFIPVLVEAVNAILELYKDKEDMHKKNRYILQYYLAMNHAKMILLEEQASVP
ncbi:MAG: hypothetical protein OIN85_00830 [Candidatus Methanoperedens sp.]|nr:hypothetical protein [Candidatus Methanoperedens sp.]